ncbi:hypothetical protein E2562_007061 [Oryza meyeriana var. granulata]|uniref:Uncharacterized protein n=1 Tax=Oryza meyeriana var. granulata TaxID=110450 RepID=A0A6G1F4S0_9ORYZ|nr:hypothetical protein E2562_007061 [Oryza meyeriana var. granulata]
MTTGSDDDAWDSEEEAARDSEKETGMSTEDDSCYDPPDIVNTGEILEGSSHRDGSIYKDICGWKMRYRIADLDEKCNNMKLQLDAALDLDGAASRVDAARPRQAQVQEITR